MARFNAPLKPFFRRLKLEAIINAIFMALAGGMIAALVTMLVMYMIGNGYQWVLLFAIAAAVAVATGLVAYFVMYRLSFKQMIRRIDAAGLQERITTMEQLWEDTSYIAKLQRQDTLRHIKSLKPRAVAIVLPLVACIVLFSVSVSAMGVAMLPQFTRKVDRDDPIYDDYTKPGLDEIVTDKEYDGALKDFIDGILDDYNNLNDSIQNGTDGGKEDSAADLEELIDRINQYLKDNVKGKLISDYMKGHPEFAALGKAFVSVNAEDIHKALYGLYLGYDQQIARVKKLIESSDASPRVKTLMIAELTTLMDGVKNTALSFDDDRAMIKDLITKLEASSSTAIFSETSIETLIAADETLAPLGNALLAGDKTAVSAAMEALRLSLIDGEAVKVAETEALIAVLDDIMLKTSDRPSGATSEDSAWVAVQNLHGKLKKQVVILAEGGDPDALMHLNAAFKVADAEFADSVEINRMDREEYDYLVQELTYIHNGRYLFAYLWNDPKNSMYLEDRDPGLAAVLRTIMEQECGIYLYPEAPPLVYAIYALIDGLEAAAKAALRDGGDYDAMAMLYGATRPTEVTVGAHETHTEGECMPKACNDILKALLGEQEIEDAVEDLKDKIEDAIDDLLGKEEEEEEEEEEDTGIDVKPPTPDTPPEGGDEEDEENESPPEQEMPPTDNNGNTNTGTENLSGMTFFNPETGKEETLTEETLAAYKAALDKAIEEGTYTQDEQVQMNRYYEYLLQKFSKNN